MPRPAGGRPIIRHLMSDQQHSSSQGFESDQGSGAAVALKTRPQRPKIDRLPPWKVLLHNDDVSEMEYVIRTIMELTRLNQQAAIMVMVEAHKTGVALVLATHREHAELLQEQFTSM